MNRPFSEENPGRHVPDREYAYEGFTPQQYAYCDARAAGLTPLYAYRQAYDNQQTPAEQVTVRASALERDARIVKRINGLLADKRQQSNLVPEVDKQERIEITRDWVGQGIAQLAQDKTVKPNVRLAAYVHAGKLTGVDAFREIVVHTKQTRTLEEIDREIARHLANMIDVTPNAPGSSLPVIEQEAKPSGRDRRRKPTT